MHFRRSSRRFAHFEIARVTTRPDHPLGSTFEHSESNDGRYNTNTFFDHLGRQYRVEQTVTTGIGEEADEDLAVAETECDGNDGVKKTVGFDDAVTLYLFNHAPA